MKNWKELNFNLKTCDKCVGLNSDVYGTQNACGYGSKNSNVVIIGQSLCGKPCIESQIPFTGGSGRLLDEAFTRADIEKKDVYTTNIMKCHPPENRKSAPHEIKNCLPYLEKELEWISPDHIICLGKDAWGRFDKSVKEPSEKKFDNATVHYLYHPSFIRRLSLDMQNKYVNKIAEIIQKSLKQKEK